MIFWLDLGLSRVMLYCFRFILFRGIMILFVWSLRMGELRLWLGLMVEIR